MNIIDLCANRKHTKFQVDISNSFWEIEVLIFGDIVNLSKWRILATSGFNKSKKNTY